MGSIENRRLVSKRSAPSPLQPLGCWEPMRGILAVHTGVRRNARLTGDIDGRFKNQQPQLSYQRIRGTFGGLICVLACHPERRGIQIRPSYSWKLTSAPEIHARHSSDGLVMHPDDNQDNRENRLSHTLNGTVFYRPLPQESP